MIAAHFDNFLFLLLVAAAVLFQFLAKAAGKTRKDQTRRTSTPIPKTPPAIPRAPRTSDEDQIRKLLEALGQPPTSRPPPPVAPQTNLPPRPLAPVQPPVSPLSQLRQERLRKREVVRKEISPSRPISAAEKIAPPKITGAPAFEVQGEPSPIAPSPSVRIVAGATQTIATTDKLRTDVAALLASTSRLRDAIILREILGPPRGLRAVEFIGT
jgi:hypothetical protein